MIWPQKVFTLKCDAKSTQQVAHTQRERFNLFFSLNIVECFFQSQKMVLGNQEKREDLAANQRMDDLKRREEEAKRRQV